MQRKLQVNAAAHLYADGPLGVLSRHGPGSPSTLAPSAASVQRHAAYVDTPRLLNEKATKCLGVIKVINTSDSLSSVCDMRMRGGGQHRNTKEASLFQKNMNSEDCSSLPQ